MFLVTPAPFLLVDIPRVWTNAVLQTFLRQVQSLLIQTWRGPGVRPFAGRSLVIETGHGTSPIYIAIENKPIMDDLLMKNIENV